MKKKRKRIRISGLIFLILLGYLICVCIFHFIKLPVRSISIIGNNLLTENEIIEMIGLEDNFPLTKVNKGYLKNKLKNITLINDFKVKKTIHGQVKITIDEAKILYLNQSNNKLVLSNEKEIENNNKYLGYPTLSTTIPDDIFPDFIKNFAKINSDSLRMISEIEYDPDIYNETIIDKERFLFIMNDGNKVYINVPNMEKMNKYQSVIGKIDIKGTLYLDSNSKNFIFKKEGINED